MHPRPIKAAHELMLTKLTALVPPHLPVNPCPNDFEATQEYLLDVARIVDQMIFEVGREVKSNSSINVDLKLFENVLRDALEGWAIFEIQREIDDMNQERAA